MGFKLIVPRVNSVFDEPNSKFSLVGQTSLFEVIEAERFIQRRTTKDAHGCG